MGATTRSRVTPGMSCTMLMRRPAKALSRLLLPTLGRPTMAMVGVFLGAAFTARQCRHAGSGHNTGRGPVPPGAQLSAGYFDNKFTILQPHDPVCYAALSRTYRASTLWPDLTSCE